MPIIINHHKYLGYSLVYNIQSVAPGVMRVAHQTKPNQTQNPNQTSNIHFALWHSSSLKLFSDCAADS